MSNVPAKIHTTPAHRRWPNATSIEAANVSPSPITVIWFGVTGSRRTADIKVSAWRRTPASNRAVNIAPLNPAGDGRSRLVVNLDNLGRHYLPCVTARLLVSVGGHPPAQLRVPGQGEQRRAQLRPSLGLHRQAVTTGFEHGQIALDLGGDDGQP